VGGQARSRRDWWSSPGLCRRSAGNAMPIHQKGGLHFYLVVQIELLLSFDFWVKLMGNSGSRISSIAIPIFSARNSEKTLMIKKKSTLVIE
jgi:hypothetical protein